METQENIIKTPDFKNIVDVLKHYKIHLKRETFIDYSKISPLELSNIFLEDLDFALSNVGIDDKETFICEFVIVPFLRHVWKLHRKLDLFSHVLLKSKDFTVVPDYLVTAKTELGYKAVEKPLLITVEAKYEKFNDGWFQAAMQMIAASQLNGDSKIPIYGIVTTGELWQFGILENYVIYQHPTSFSIRNPQEIAGLLSFIFGECEKNAELLK